MGSVDVSVGSAKAVSIAQAHSTGIVITNTGINTVYLDNETNVSPTVNDFVLRPNTSIQWQDNTPCWAICAPGFPSTLSVSQNIKAFSAGSGLVGSANTAADVLWSGTFAQFVALQKSLDVSAYSSIRIHLQPALVTSSRAVLANFSSTAPPRISMAWNADGSDMSSSFWFPGNYDDVVVRPSNLTEFWGVDLILDVKDSYLALWQGLASFYNNYCTGATQPFLSAYTLIITGFVNRRPQLCREFDAINATNQLNSRVYSSRQIAVPIGTPITPFFLPLWSGRIRVDVNEVYNVAPTTRGRFYLLNATQDGFNAVSQNGEASPDNPTASFHAALDISGGRGYRTVNWVHGTGYATVSLGWQVTFYGSEDS